MVHFTDRDHSEFSNHMATKHKAFFNIELSLAVSLMDEEERQIIIRQQVFWNNDVEHKKGEGNKLLTKNQIKPETDISMDNKKVIMEDEYQLLYPFKEETFDSYFNADTSVNNPSTDQQDGGVGSIMTSMNEDPDDPDEPEDISKAMVKMPPKTGLTMILPTSQPMSAAAITTKAVMKVPLQGRDLWAGKHGMRLDRARIMLEVLEEHISPADLGKKYGISAHAIRDWIKKAGHALPKSYKRRNTPYPMEASGTIGYERIDYSRTVSQGLPPRPLGPHQQGGQTRQVPELQKPWRLHPLHDASGISGYERIDSGSTVSHKLSHSQVSQRLPGKLAPGKLAKCKSCGFTGKDLAVCIRCRRKMSDDVKIVEDPNFQIDCSLSNASSKT